MNQTYLTGLPFKSRPPHSANLDGPSATDRLIQPFSATQALQTGDHQMKCQNTSPSADSLLSSPSGIYPRIIQFLINLDFVYFYQPNLGWLMAFVDFVAEINDFRFRH